MTLIQALTHSINTIAVKLSISIGNGNAKVGRAKIVKLAHDMGIRTPLPDTPSLPIGADEVTVLDHTGAYATFPNMGKAVTPHASSKCVPAPAIWSGVSTATDRSRGR